MAKFTNVVGSAIGSASQIDSLVVDYNSIVNSNNALINSIIFGTTNPQGIFLNGSGSITSLSNNKTILTFSSIENFQVTGTRSNDILVGSDYDRNLFNPNNPYDDDRLNGADGDDNINGRGGDDLLIGGNGNDSLMGGTGRDEMHGGAGNDKLFGQGADWLNDTVGINDFYTNEAAKVTANTQTTLHANFSSPTNTGVVAFYNGAGYGVIQNGFGGVIDQISGGLAFNIKLSQNNDVINGEFAFGNNDTLVGNGGNDVINSGNGNDTVTGDDGNDSINGAAGNDTITGGIGNDTLVGSAGNDKLTGATGGDVIDGGAGNDSIEGGLGADQLYTVSGSDTVSGGDGDDVIYAVADINGDTKQVYGNDGADKFVLDASGTAGLIGFKFNTETLANFVNAITLPEDTGLDWQQMGIDMAFSTVGSILGEIPVVGSVASILTSLGEIGYGSYQEAEELKAQIQAQATKATQAAADYKDADWGSITSSGTRDLVFINDFKIGIDSILLPKLPENGAYTIRSGNFPHNISGVFVSLKLPAGSVSVGNSGEYSTDIAFIVNSYRENINQVSTKQLTDEEFSQAIENSLEGNQIGVFRDTVFHTANAPGVEQVLEGSFANDRIEGQSANDHLFGYYGSDVITGGLGNDNIYGGSNQNTAYLPYERSASNPNAPYLNDGNDIMSGGEGNDGLYGESGDDFLNGDAFVEGANGNSIAIGNGNDSLYGGTGNDTLQGGAGSDTLSGGDGFDTFQFNTVLDGSFDRIIDFNPTQDSIQLDTAIFTQFLAATGVQADNFTSNDIGLALDANDFLIFNNVSGALLYDADGSDTGASAVQFAQLELVGGTLPSLTAADFVLA